VSSPDRVVAGRYRLLERIGGGGMGAVWLARDELLGRDIAIKQVLPPTSADEAAARQQRERALREGRIAARLSHPHAISVYDVALENDQPWLVMEYLPSRSLSEVLAEDGLLREDQAAQIGAQVADALAATHAAGIVHRDVKPANILIGKGGRVDGLVKITDFGISHASGDVTLTQTGQITGTPAFLAPEVAQGYEPGPAADVFSLASTLYTCLEGEPPFGMAGNSLQQLHRVAAGTIKPPQRCGSLTAPLMRMLAVDPRDRPSMTEVRDELVKLAAGGKGDTTTVLMARTDLAGPGRPPVTAVAPAAVVADTPPEPVAAAPPPSPPPVRPPAPPPPPTRADDAPAGPPARRRISRTAVLAAAVVAVLAGLVLFWALALDDPADTTAAPETPSSSAPAGTTSESPEETQASEGSATSSSSEPPAETTASTSPQNGNSGSTIDTDSAEEYLQEYHELVFDDPAAAYQQAGPTLQNAISQEGFQAYWGDFSDVAISDVQVEEGGNTALAVMEFEFPDGSQQVERHRFTFIREDGRLVLDSDVFVEVLEDRG
jgi:serine/threonine protein kinase